MNNDDDDELLVDIPCTRKISKNNLNKPKTSIKFQHYY